MTGIAYLLQRLDQQVQLISAMGCMAFETGTDSRRAMEEIAGGETLVTMGAESIRGNYEAGVGALVVAIVTAFFGKGGMNGVMLNALE